MGPDQPAMVMTGRETVRMLGGLWVICEGSGEVPDGSTMTYVMTLGFDTEKKRFVGTWVGSVGSSMFVYEGELDASGKLPLNCEGPSCMEPGTQARYQDTIEMVGHDRRTLSSRVQKKDGAWVSFMKAVYTRVS
jgi:hypothetical protein